MLKRLSRARSDVALMNRILPAALVVASGDGVAEPAAEHLLVAALEEPDGVAAAAIRDSGGDPGQVRDAIRRQHQSALESVGVAVDEVRLDAALPPGADPGGVYRGTPSLNAGFQRAIALAKADRAALNSGYLLLGVTEPERGIVARALTDAGIDRVRLREKTCELLRSRPA